MRIARIVEFDAGHRVPGHHGKCRSPHGHRYKVEVVIDGAVAEDGMVLDFGVLADSLRRLVHDPRDHAFMLDASDEAGRAAMRTVPDWKVYVMDGPPTAENIAADIGRVLRAVEGLPVVEVVVWETPNCWAVWTP